MGPQRPPVARAGMQHGCSATVSPSPPKVLYCPCRRMAPCCPGVTLPWTTDLGWGNESPSMPLVKAGPKQPNYRAVGPAHIPRTTHSLSYDRLVQRLLQGGRPAAGHRRGMDWVSRDAPCGVDGKSACVWVQAGEPRQGGCVSQDGERTSVGGGNQQWLSRLAGWAKPKLDALGDAGARRAQVRARARARAHAKGGEREREKRRSTGEDWSTRRYGVHTREGRGREERREERPVTWSGRALPLASLSAFNRI